jgi:hypothetical protein
LGLRRNGNECEDAEHPHENHLEHTNRLSVV